MICFVSACKLQDKAQKKTNHNDKQGMKIILHSKQICVFQNSRLYDMDMPEQFRKASCFLCAGLQLSKTLLYVYPNKTTS